MDWTEPISFDRETDSKTCTPIPRNLNVKKDTILELNLFWCPDCKDQQILDVETDEIHGCACCQSDAELKHITFKAKVL